MKLLIPKSRLHVYHGGHLGLVTEAAELAPVVDAFLTAPLTVSGGLSWQLRPDRPDRRRLLPARADSRYRGPPAAAPGQGVHGEVGPAGHQPLLDPGGVPVRPGGAGLRQLGIAGQAVPGLRLPGRRQPARRHDRDGAGPGRPVHRDVLRRAQRPGHGVHLPVRLGGAEAALAARDGADGEDRRVRPHRARRRVRRRGRADHHRPAGRRASGCWTGRRSGSATRRSPTT